MLTTEEKENAIHLSPLRVKFFDTLFATAAILVSISYMMPSLPQTWMQVIYASGTLSFLYRHGFWVFGLPIAVGVSLYWHKKERGGFLLSAKYRSLCHTIVRYNLCFLISRYGFLKLLGGQFYLGINLRDVPLEKVNGFFLTWYYFGYSRPMVIPLASISRGLSL